MISECVNLNLLIILAIIVILIIVTFGKCNKRENLSVTTNVSSEICNITTTPLQRINGAIVQPTNFTVGSTYYTTSGIKDIAGNYAFYISTVPIILHKSLTLYIYLYNVSTIERDGTINYKAPLFSKAIGSSFNNQIGDNNKIVGNASELSIFQSSTCGKVAILDNNENTIQSYKVGQDTVGSNVVLIVSSVNNSFSLNWIDSKDAILMVLVSGKLGVLPG